MFKDLGPCDVAVFVDVADDDDRDVEALRGAKEQVRAFPDLGDGAGGRGQLYIFSPFNFPFLSLIRSLPGGLKLFPTCLSPHLIRG